MASRKTTHQQDDITFVEHFLNTIGENITPKAVVRLGKHGASSNRPIKITFESLTEKETIMKNLRNLKGKEEFHGVHIRDDYTLAERMMIREYVTKARKKNETEEEASEILWKVRGDPKSGLYLKRFLKCEIDKDRSETREF